MKKGSLNKLIAGVFILLLAALVFVTARHMGGDDSVKPKAPEETEAELSINNFRHTATSKGRTEWTLKAETAEYYKGSRKVRLKNLSLTFYPESGKPRTHLTADSGIVDLKTHDADISGNILVKNPGYRLEAKTLHYRHESNIITSHKHIKLTGSSVLLTADEMEYDLETRRIECRGNVEGTLNDNEKSENSN